MSANQTHMKCRIIFTGTLIVIMILLLIIATANDSSGESSTPGRGLPALVILSVDPNNISMTRGEEVNVIVTVKNYGDDDAHYVDIYYIIEPELQYFKSFDFIGANETNSTTFTISFEESGSYIVQFLGKDDGSEFGKKRVLVEVSPLTLYVDDNAGEDGNGSIQRPFKTIQKAVDAAFNSDTIRVFDGEYLENVVVDVSISIVGNGSETTTIRADVEGAYAMEINAEGVTLTGFNVTDARGEMFNAAGIRLTGNHTHVYGNVFSDNDNGILVESANNVIEDNTFQENLNGIMVQGSHGNSVDGNEFIKNSNGIRIIESQDSLVQGNTFSGTSGNVFAIFLDNVLSSTIANNTFPNPYDGITMSESRNTVFHGNSFEGGGISISGGSILDWNTHEIDTSNTIDGNPIRYYANESGILISENTGQIILANCSSIDIEGIDLRFSSIGIQIGFSSHITISECSFLLQDYAIRIFDSMSIHVINSSLSAMVDYGISVIDSEDCIIEGNDFVISGKYAVTMLGSNYNTIENNTMFFGSGIYLQSSDYNSISYNSLEYGGNGIYLYMADFNEVKNNSILNCTYGIVVLGEAQQNIIHGNSISGSNDFGIDASGNNAYIVFATNNWWGDESGPYHPEKNPDGLGDNVSDYVEFDPWTGKENDTIELPDPAVKSINILTPVIEKGYAIVEVIFENRGNVSAHNIEYSIISLMGSIQISDVIESMEAHTKKVAFGDNFFR